MRRVDRWVMRQARRVGCTSAILSWAKHLLKRLILLRNTSMEQRRRR